MHKIRGVTVCAVAKPDSQGKIVKTGLTFCSNKHKMDILARTD